MELSCRPDGMNPLTKDFQLVCDDGKVGWSSRDLSLWSGVLRAFLEAEGLTCPDCRSRRAVLLLPGVASGLVERALEWSGRGEVGLGGGGDVEEARSVLAGLGATADTIQELENSFNECQQKEEE